VGPRGWGSPCFVWATLQCPGSACREGEPPGLTARRSQFEDGIAKLLRLRVALDAVVDSDGALGNWLVDVVCAVRRGNSGSARYELDQPTPAAL
jgi:hypothetical protein